MRPNSVVHFCLGAVICLAWGAAAFADDSYIRMGGLIGYGESGVKTNSVSRVESPAAFSIFFDYALTSRYGVQIEHERGLSLSPSQSATSFTGLVFKSYFWSPMPQILPDSDKALVKTNIAQYAWTPYAGLGLGFAQSSIVARNDLEADANAVGIFAKAIGGVEYPLWGHTGLRLEASFGQSFAGAGTIVFLHAMAGVYYFF